MSFSRTDHSCRPGHENKEAAQLKSRKKKVREIRGSALAPIASSSVVYHEPTDLRTQRTASSQWCAGVEDTP